MSGRRRRSGGADTPRTSRLAGGVAWPGAAAAGGPIATLVVPPPWHCTHPRGRPHPLRGCGRSAARLGGCCPGHHRCRWADTRGAPRRAPTPAPCAAAHHTAGWRRRRRTRAARLRAGARGVRRRWGEGSRQPASKPASRQDACMHAGGGRCHRRKPPTLHTSSPQLRRERRQRPVEQQDCQARVCCQGLVAQESAAQYSRLHGWRRHCSRCLRRHARRCRRLRCRGCVATCQAAGARLPVYRRAGQGWRGARRAEKQCWACSIVAGAHAGSGLMELEPEWVVRIERKCNLARVLAWLASMLCDRAQFLFLSGRSPQTLCRLFETSATSCLGAWDKGEAPGVWSRPVLRCVHTWHPLEKSGRMQ